MDNDDLLPYKTFQIKQIFFDSTANITSSVNSQSIADDLITSIASAIHCKKIIAPV
jgi:hypothetical protein